MYFWYIVSRTQSYVVFNFSNFQICTFLFNQCVRGLDEKCPSKKRFEYLLRHLSFWVSDMESPLIFVYIKKEKEKILITKYMNE